MFPFQKQPPEVFYKKGVPKNFAIFTGKHMCWSLFFNKVAGVACNFIKNEIPTHVFPVNITKFLRIPILKNIYERLLPLTLFLQMISSLSDIMKILCS